jgi:hypothetical protein
MNLPHYVYKTNKDFLDYEFVSRGPKGDFKKIVHFSRIEENVFNLGFGDLHEETGEISDIVVTNNRDSNKVLATVALIVNDFTLKYPYAFIVIKGSTHSRTRLYRMGISNHWHEIGKDFEVFGLKDKTWEAFEKRKDYEAFLIRRK